MIRIIAITAFALCFIACNKQTNEREHDHGPEPLAYTLYSDKSEIFVEFKPLVVGVASKFAAHFTVLGDNFTPLNEGKVTVSLVLGTKGIRQTSDTPAVPGIYRLSLTPAVSGIGKLIFDIETKNFTDQIVIDSITVYPDEKSALADQPKETDDANNITYLKEQAWKVDFANTPVEVKSFSNVIRTNGQLISAPGDELIISANADGVVVFSGLSTITGSPVSQGTHLFSIAGGANTKNNVDAAYLESKANFEKAKADYDRAQELAKDRIISQKEFLQYKQTFENAQVNFNTISKNYSSTGQKITSDISGFIKNILVSEGQYVTIGTPLAIISKNKKLLLQANVSQKYFSEISRIKSANFITPNSDSVYSLEQLNGKLISYGKSTSVNSPFIPITFELNNSENLIPGSIVDIYLKSEKNNSAMIIPSSALMEEQGNFFVYVQVEGESFQKREVILGATDGIHVQVLKGVKAGERVVSKGAYQIKLSSASGTLPAHGHEH